MAAYADARCDAGLSVELPSGLQSPTGKPPLASPGHPVPTRTSSERSLSAASTPGKAPLAGSGGSGAATAAALASKGVPMKGDRGRFKVYEVRHTLGCAAACFVLLFCTCLVRQVLAHSSVVCCRPF